MKKGDRLKVISTVNKRIKESIGTIEDIGTHSILIVKENKNGDKIKESFSIGDLMDKYKKKFLDTGCGWESIKFEQRGNKIVPVKIVKRDNASSVI